MITHFPQVKQKNNFMSATAKLRVEVSELHAGENGQLEISCQATIPSFPIYRNEYADYKKKTVQG